MSQKAGQQHRVGKREQKGEFSNKGLIHNLAQTMENPLA